MSLDITSAIEASAPAKIPFAGINHLALVCSDMERTVHFYRDVLGMPLVKTIQLPDGGQHFFFDCGGTDCVAFFWFPNGPSAAPGIAAAGGLPGSGGLESAVGSMNHVAFDVPADQLDRCLGSLRAAGVEALGVVNHDDSRNGVSKEFHDGVFLRSIYFQDPDGILLELTAWTRELSDEDVRHDPARAADRPAV